MSDSGYFSKVCVSSCVASSVQYEDTFARQAAVFWDGAQPALRNPRGAAWLWSTGDSRGTALLRRDREEQAV